ncbi:MAG: hypothetical protein WEK74_08000 [Hydrogenophaga sp.]
MTPRFAQTLRLAAQGAGRTQEAEPGDPAGLRLSLADLLHMHGEASGPVVLMLLAVLATLPVAGGAAWCSVKAFFGWPGLGRRAESTRRCPTVWGG